MQISRSKRFPGYHPRAREAKVWLNGILQPLWVAADDESNTIEVYVEDNKGNPTFTLSGLPLTRRLQGSVVIQLPDGFEQATQTQSNQEQFNLLGELDDRTYVKSRRNRVSDKS